MNIKTVGGFKMKNVFKVISQSDPERIQIKYSDKGVIYLINTPEGFIVDVYNNDETQCINTLTVWDEDWDIPFDDSEERRDFGNDDEIRESYM